MKYYIIGYGLSGGFGGIKDFEVVKCHDEKEALEWSYEKACQFYKQYDGLHGLRSLDIIMKEDELEYEDAEEVWKGEREWWLDYLVEPYSKERAEELSVYHFDNIHEEEIKEEYD